MRRWERGARGRRNWIWRRRAPQLSAGTPGPTPATPPPRPRRSPFLPRLPRGARPGCTLCAGALQSRTFLRVCVRSPASPGPRRPYLPPRGPGLHAEGAGGGRRREEASRARRRARSPERSPLQLQPWSTPSFPPGERGDGGGSRERKSRVPSATRRSSTARHEPNRRRRRRRRGGRWVNRRPEPWSWAAGWPRPSRRAGMRGRAPWRPITARRPPGPPRACLPGP